jgi:hypothetical protein
VRAHRDGLTLATIHQARIEFIALMNKPGSPFDWNAVPVFRFMREASANGVLEEYDYWLYGPAFPQEFETWARENPSSAEELGRYMGDHPLFVAPAERLAREQLRDLCRGFLKCGCAQIFAELRSL